MIQTNRPFILTNIIKFVFTLLLATSLWPQTLACSDQGLRPWKSTKHWAYQLQALDLDKLRASPFDLLVIDYSQDGTDQRRFTKENIESLKTIHGKQRFVLAYLSIGEAEDYRYYWQKSWARKRPVWLDQENPEWRGNYKVRYWSSEWYLILINYLEKIISAGFDGVYLDIIDAYEYYENKGHASAREEMKALVNKIAHYARNIKGKSNFGIFPQNGESLLADPQYLRIITGIGKEDTYFGYDDENLPSPITVSAEIEQYLDLAIKAGKLVLNVDYTTDPGQMRQAYSKAENRGYVEYCATRNLDRLVSQPWFQ